MADNPASKKLLYWAAGLAIGAVVAHAIDSPEHLLEWWGYSTFFVVAAAFQLFYGFALLFRPWRYDEHGGIQPNSDARGMPFYIFGIILSSAVVAVYILSRTSALSVLDIAASARPVTALSLIPAVENLPLIGCLAALIAKTRHAG